MAFNVLPGKGRDRGLDNATFTGNRFVAADQIGQGSCAASNKHSTNQVVSRTETTSTHVYDIAM